MGGRLQRPGTGGYVVIALPLGWRGRSPLLRWRDRTNKVPRLAQVHRPPRLAVLREVFLPPVEAAVREAAVASIMPSYNEVDGISSHANRWLVRDVLRGEWVFAA